MAGASFFKLRHTCLRALTEARVISSSHICRASQDRPHAVLLFPRLRLGCTRLLLDDHERFDRLSACPSPSATWVAT